MTQYESILDPSTTWLANLVLHEYNECWLYYSFMEQEPDKNVKALYELHLNMEIEHLRIAVEMMRQLERRDPEELLPLAIEKPLMFQENKEYVRQVLANQIDLTARESKFIPIGKLGRDDRYYAYQSIVNRDSVPSELVIDETRSSLGEDYRLETNGPHPVPGLVREQERDGAETGYAAAAD